MSVIRLTAPSFGIEFITLPDDDDTEQIPFELEDPELAQEAMDWLSITATKVG
jgi:hypothetical protein